MARVLVIDDSVELLDFFSLLMKTKGFEVKTVSDTRQLELIILNFNPDVILLDVKLNSKDGRLICREIKQNKNTGHVPVILLSADPELLCGYKSYEADDVIEKPFNISLVLEKVTAFIKKAGRS